MIHISKLLIRACYTLLTNRVRQPLFIKNSWKTQNQFLKFLRLGPIKNRFFSNFIFNFYWDSKVNKKNGLAQNMSHGKKWASKLAINDSWLFSISSLIISKFFIFEFIFWPFFSRSTHSRVVSHDLYHFSTLSRFLAIESPHFSAQMVCKRFFILARIMFQMFSKNEK